MDTDINDIWDLPVETSVSHLPADNPNGDGSGNTSPSRASSHPLFLPSDDDEDTTAAAAAATATAAEPTNPQNADIDALFEGLDDMDDSFHELAPSLDLDALRREADARNTRAVRAEIAAMVPTAELSSAAAGNKTNANGRKGGGALDGIGGEGEAEDDEKKKRKPVPKLDEARLLGKNGFLQLIKDTKHFKPKGKGHEATDLDRALQVYQFWTHKLYPKTRFKETVDRVEKLCHSKRMQVALSVWRDEAHGLVNGVCLPPELADDGSDADSDVDGARAPRGDGAVPATADQGAASSSRPVSPARSRARLRRGDDGVSATSDSEGDNSDGVPLSSDASHPPPSSPGRDNAAIELDALLEEEEALRVSTGAAPTSHAWKATSSGDAAAMDEDEDLWDMLHGGAPTTAGPVTAPAPPAVDDDEDMWDIVNEIEQEKAKEAARQPNPVQEPPAVTGAQVDYLDDLYL